jgi:DNA-directed RNA polymerase specialized sigma24 family protein
LESLDKAVAERLLKIDDDTWGDIYLELLDYAQYKTGRLTHVKGGGELPLGQTPQDLVQDAIDRLFTGRRRWDPDQDPDLTDYLKSVIKSLLSALLEKTDYDHRDDAPLEDHYDLTSGEDANYNDCLEALQQILEEESSDDSDLENVRMGLEDRMKASEIAEFFRIDVARVYTLSRKLRRRTSKKMGKHPCHDHWTRLGF